MLFASRNDAENVSKNDGNVMFTFGKTGGHNSPEGKPKKAGILFVCLKMEEEGISLVCLMMEIVKTIFS